jgi:hypothetical protein
VQELLEKVEENSSGEEQWDINFRYLIDIISVAEPEPQVAASL